MSATTWQGTSDRTSIWRPLHSGPLSLLALLLVVACSLAIVLLVAAMGWAALHPWNDSLWDRRWHVLTGAWSLGLMLLLLIGRPRLAVGLTWSIVSLIALAAALFGGVLWSMAAAVWIVILAAAWGDLILRAAVQGQSVSAADRIALGVPIGFTVLGIIVFALALVQALAFWSISGLLLLLTGGAAWAWSRGGFPAPPIAALRPPGRLQAFVLGAGALFFAGGLLLAIAPEIKFDALNYQLAMPEQYVRAGGLVEVPWNFRSYWFGNVALIWAAALQVAGQPTPQVIHLLMGVVLAIQAFAAGSRWLGTAEGWVAALLVATTPVVQEIATSSYIDVFVATIAFGAVYAAVRWYEQRIVGWMIAFAALAGGAVSAKLNTLIILVPAALVLVGAVLLDRPRRVRGTLTSLLLGAGIAAATAAPWLVLRWAWTGNPMFPFLNNLFRSPLWPPENARFNWEQFGTGTGLVPLLRIPWEITTNAPAFGEALLPGATGALVLLGLPLFLPLIQPARRGAVLLFALMMLAGFVAWFLTTPYVRYGIALFPGLAVLAAGNLVGAYNWLARTRVAPALGAVTLVAGGAYLWAASASAAVSHWEDTERYRVSVAFGIETRGEFLERQLPFYRAYQWLNDRHDPDLRVLAVGEAFNLYLNGLLYVENGSNGLPSDPLLRLPAEDPAALAQALQEFGFDFLLVRNDVGQDDDYQQRTPLLTDRKRFLRKYARPKYADEVYTVYRLLAPREDQAMADRAAPPSSSTDAPPSLRAGQGESEPMVSPALEEIGPNPVEAGAPFNTQPDGTEAVWAIGGNFEEGSVLIIAGVQLDTVFQDPTLVTARVPEHLFAEPGDYEARVIGPNGQSNSVQWTVIGPAGTPNTDGTPFSPSAGSVGD